MRLSLAMQAVSVCVVLAFVGLLWLHLARARRREELAAHRRIHAGQARFWTARLQADDARAGGDPAAADARLHECARHLAALRGLVADLPGLEGGSAPAAVERLHAAQEELRRMQESMLRGPLDAAERGRIQARVGRLGTAALDPGPAVRPLRYGEPDAMEKGIRFAFGFFFGVGFAFLLLLRRPLGTDAANVAAMAAMAGVCGLMALRFGDRFWFWISDNLYWLGRWTSR